MYGSVCAYVNAGATACVRMRLLQIYILGDNGPDQWPRAKGRTTCSGAKDRTTGPAVTVVFVERWRWLSWCILSSCEVFEAAPRLTSVVVSIVSCWRGSAWTMFVKRPLINHLFSVCSHESVGEPLPLKGLTPLPTLCRRDPPGLVVLSPPPTSCRPVAAIDAISPCRRHRRHAVCRLHLHRVTVSPPS